MPASAQRQRQTTTSSALLIVTGSLLLLAACGRQDLYEPPGSPYEIVGRLRLPAASTGIAIMERHAYVAGGEAGLHCVDWSAATSPVLLSTVTTVRTADDVQVVRTFHDHAVRDVAHVVEGTEGISSYDITDPSAPRSFNTGTTATFGRSVFIDQPLDPRLPYTVYMAEDWRGVRHFESALTEPGFLNYNGVVVRTQGRAYGVAVRDGWGYCAQNEMGLCVLDLRVLNPAWVRLAAAADTPGNARAVALAGAFAFIADGREGLAVFAIDGGETPVKVAQYVLNGFSVAIALRDGLCALAANAAGVHFLDVRDPTKPIYLGTTATRFATGVVFAPDGHCLVADAEEGLLILAGRGPFLDTTPPSPVTDLEAATGSMSTVDLTWTMTGDDRMLGLAAGLDIRFAAAPIVDLDGWELATSLPGLPQVAGPGTVMRFTAGGLAGDTEYHFAVRVHDAAGNVSQLSNSASARTSAGIVLRNPRVDRSWGYETDLFTFEVEALWDEPLTASEIIIDGIAQTMVRGEGYLYRYQTTLPRGRHTHAFRFAAAGVPDAVTEEFDGPVVAIAAFTMGSPAGEPGRGSDEVQRTVAFSRDIVAATTEVTQAQWAQVMPAGSDPSVHLGAARPVDSVTWLQAIAYCNALSLAEGRTPAYAIAGMAVTWDQEADGWRLPTEAEWEYLCRAGSAAAFANGPLTALHCRLDPNLDAIGWYCGNGATGTATVAGKQPNASGSYDMSGNVREWCWDWYGPLSDATALDPLGAETGYLRVCRGGSWYNTSQDCRSAARGARPPDSADDTVGLRVVRTVFED